MWHYYSSFSSGTATNGEDYIINSHLLGFNPLTGYGIRCTRIYLVNDFIQEHNETIRVMVLGLLANVYVTIVDNDEGGRSLVINKDVLLIFFYVCVCI